MKKSNAEFIQLSLGLCHKLADEKIGWAAFAMICALTETWFNTGRHRQHLNPFRLDLCDTRKWGLTRMHKCRALKFLAKVRLVAVDRRDLNNPLVTLAWEPRYPAKALFSPDDGAVSVVAPQATLVEERITS
jgi:hypothetical protein